MATVTLPKREITVDENLHYVKPISDTLGITDLNEYVLAGDGITDWTQSSNPNTDEGQYIHEANKHTSLLGYGPQVSYTATAYPGDAFNLWLYKIGKLEIKDAQFEEIEVETWNKTSDGVFNAYKRVYDVHPSNPGSGEGGGKLGMEGTFSQKGSVVSGMFDIKTKTFTTENS